MKTSSPIASLALGCCAALSGLASPWAPAATRLNDTGASMCVDESGQFSSDCSGTGQDGESGRDATTPKAKDGRVGFSFQKVCNNGDLAGTGKCPRSPKLGTGKTDWGCTYDRVTKLMWEVKTTDGGLRDMNAQFTHFPDGRAGSALAYVAAVNAAGLCGQTNMLWRLPSPLELLGIVDLGVPYPGPVIDLAWFPNSLSGMHWTREQVAGMDAQAFGVNFYSGFVGNFYADGRTFNGYVRLVRDYR